MPAKLNPMRQVTILFLRRALVLERLSAPTDKERLGCKKPKYNLCSIFISILALKSDLFYQCKGMLDVPASRT